MTNVLSASPFELSGSQETILGAVDPATLTREEFHNSSDLLFHGSSKPFVFVRSFDYDNNTEGDGSYTLGGGFYCTDNRQIASGYSLVRQGGKVGTPAHVAGFLPYQARMLDLRSSSDSTNEPMPLSLVLAWQKRFNQLMADHDPTAPRAWLFSLINDEYPAYLASAINAGNLDLRVILETSPGYHNDTHRARALISPPGQDLFSRFMGEQGYDGIIYTEGGEGKHAAASPSFVFYNTAKIGTYETWQELAHSYA